MRWIRPIVLVLFLFTLAGYVGMRVYDEAYLDHTAPVITSKKDTIKVKVTASSKKLKRKLKATDDRDGDITDKIEIESIGPMLSDGSRQISYVVCDSSNNVGRYTRTLKYKNYRSPRIYLDEALVFYEGQEINLLEHMRADDVLDGDLTSKIQCINTDLYLSSPVAGSYELTFQVSNSAGDSTDFTTPVTVLSAEEQTGVPRVVLKEYIVYLEKGDSFDPYQYLKEARLGSRSMPVKEESDHEWGYYGYRVEGLVSSRTYISEKAAPNILFYRDFQYSGNVNTYSAGTYEVTYKITTEDGVSGEAVLTVIVE